MKVSSPLWVALAVAAVVAASSSPAGNRRQRGPYDENRRGLLDPPNHQSNTDTTTTTTTDSSTSDSSTSTTPSTTSTTPSSTSTPPTSTPSSSSSTPFSSTPPPTSTIFFTASGNDTLSAPTSTNTAPPGPSITHSTIIGLSVAGGIAAMGIIAFIIWKFSKKRFSEFEDDEGAIKWPDLNSDANAMHPLPARPTGRAGIETSTLDASESNDGHGGGYDQRGYDQHSLAAASTEFPPPVGYAASPYSQPAPPSVAYYDNDPNNPEYYDPYRGPVPQTISTPPPGQEPPVQYGAYGGPRTRSPGPTLAYTDGSESIYSGRRSPGPNAMGAPRSNSPGPAVAYGGGRASPGAGLAYRGGRAMSPGPDNAYGGL